MKIFSRAECPLVAVGKDQRYKIDTGIHNIRGVWAGIFSIMRLRLLESDAANFISANLAVQFSSCSLQLFSRPERKSIDLRT